jgi:hypothetical protein
MEFKLGEVQNKVHFPNHATVQIDTSSHAASSWLSYSLGVPQCSTHCKMYLSNMQNPKVVQHKHMHTIQINGPYDLF